MGWEKRGGKLVYYRKVRCGARVRSIYCGAGARGEAAARADAARRAACATPAGTDIRHEKKETAPAAAAAPDGRMRPGESYGAYLKRVTRPPASWASRPCATVRSASKR